MSTAAMRSLSGPITIGEFPPNESFADRLARAGFFVPDQAYMRHLMMVTSLNLGWNASAANIDVARRNPPKAGWVPFRDFTLEHYGHVQRGQMGAPMPQEVSSHIAAVSSQFPEAKVE